MTRIVLDTNVLDSSLLVPLSSPSKIFQLFLNQEISLDVSGAILEEYGRALRYKKLKLPLNRIITILSLIEREALVVIPEKHFEIIKEDPADNEFLNVAVEAQVDFLVSGDHHLLSLKIFHEIPIVTPAQYLTYHDRI